MLYKIKITYFSLLMVIGTSIALLEKTYATNPQNKPEDQDFTIPEIDGKLPPQLYFDIKRLKTHSAEPYQVKTENIRFLYGASGNGVRKHAKAYADSCNGIFIEYNAQTIADNYKKFGKTAINNIFKYAHYEANKSNRPAFIYIADIEEFSNTELKLLLLEAKKNEHANIFIILGTHKKEKLSEDTLKQLPSTQIHIDYPDRETRWRILINKFIDDVAIEDLSEKVEAAWNNLTEQERKLVPSFLDHHPLKEELGKNDSELVLTVNKYIEEGSKLSFWRLFDPSSFKQAKQNFLKTHNTMVQRCNSCITKISEIRSDQSLSMALKNYYFIAQKFYIETKNLFLRVIFILDHGSYPMHKLADQTDGLDKRSVESMAQKILEAAYTENNGELSEEIIKNKFKELRGKRLS